MRGRATLEVQFGVKRGKKRHQKSVSPPSISRRLDSGANFHQVSANWGWCFGKIPTRATENRHASSRCLCIVEVSTLWCDDPKAEPQENKNDTLLLIYSSGASASSVSMWGEVPLRVRRGGLDATWQLQTPQHSRPFVDWPQKTRKFLLNSTKIPLMTRHVAIKLWPRAGGDDNWHSTQR